MREVFCSIVSAVVFRLLFVFFIFEFGVVGATLGVIARAVIGWSNKRLKEGIIIGAVLGTTLSYKLIKTIFDYLLSDDAEELVFLVQLVSQLYQVKLIAGDLVKVLGHGEHKIMGFNKALVGKAYSLVDSSLKDCD